MNIESLQSAIKKKLDNKFTQTKGSRKGEEYRTVVKNGKSYRKYADGDTVYLGDAGQSQAKAAGAVGGLNKNDNPRIPKPKPIAPKPVGWGGKNAPAPTPLPKRGNAPDALQARNQMALEHAKQKLTRGKKPTARSTGGFGAKR